jgi:hypothetical protein
LQCGALNGGQRRRASWQGGRSRVPRGGGCDRWVRVGSGINLSQDAPLKVLGTTTSEWLGEFTNVDMRPFLPTLIH